MSETKLVTIYPSDVLAARDLAIVKNDKDKKGFGAFRLNVKKSRKNKAGNTTWYAWEIFLDEKRGWQGVSLKFLNLTHVGKISPLEDRAKQQVQDIALLFKGDYKYKRMVPSPDGKTKIEKEERYGEAKDYINQAFMAHVKKYMDKGEIFAPGTKIIPNVKHERQYKDKSGKFVTEKIEPANINVSIKFAGADVTEAAKKSAGTKFKTQILDATRPKKPTGPDDFPFEVAKVRRMIKKDDGTSEEVVEDIVNGNIHSFIRGGSIITGVDLMSDVCLSNMGASLPSQLDTIIVKQSSPTRVTAGNFDQDDWAAVSGAKTVDDVAPSNTSPSDDAAATGVVAPDEFGDGPAPADEFAAPAGGDMDFF